MADFLILVAGAALLAETGTTATQVHDDEVTPWAEFSRGPARGVTPMTVRIGTIPPEPGGAPVHWAERVGPGQEARVDERDCPALLEVIESLGTIPMPKLDPGPPALPDAKTSYSVSVQATFDMFPPSTRDRLTLTASSGPLGTWVENALQSLEGCWPRS